MLKFYLSKELEIIESIENPMDLIDFWVWNKLIDDILFEIFIFLDLASGPFLLLVSYYISSNIVLETYFSS